MENQKKRRGDFDYIVVGKGKDSTSSWLLETIPDNDFISDSGNAYWIHSYGTIFECGMKIFKTSKDGMILQKMINDGRPLSEMKRFIDEIIKEHITLPQMIECIEEIKKNAFRDGKEQRSYEFCKLLNIRQ